MHKSYKLVTIADRDNGIISNDQEKNVRKINNLEIIISRNVTRHASWTFSIDAILIRSVVKHGWIEREYQYDMIAKDVLQELTLSKKKTNHSVEDLGVANCHEKTLNKNQHESEILGKVAERARAFLIKHSGIVGESKGFDKERVMKSYGLTYPHDSSIDFEENSCHSLLVIDKDKLMSPENADIEKQHTDVKDAFTLPSKKELTKRAKHILLNISFDDTTGGVKHIIQGDVPPTNVPPEFTILERNHKCCTLLAEIMSGLISVSFSNPSRAKAKMLFQLVCEEARELQKSGLRTDDHFLNIVKHVKLAETTKHSNIAKNVIRAILGIPPIARKNEMLFPDSINLPAVETSIPGFVNTLIDGKGIKKLHRDKTVGEQSIARGFALFKQQNNHTNASMSNSNGEDCSPLYLSSFEVIILSVICSHGLPVWSTDWEKLLKENTQKNEFEISWYILGQMIESTAKELLMLATKQVEASTRQLNSQVGLSAEKSSSLTTVTHLHQKLVWDMDRDKMTLDRVIFLMGKPNDLAGKVIDLVESLRQRIGTIDMHRGSSLRQIRLLNRSANGLGPRVLQWCNKEIGRWTECLSLKDSNTRLQVSNLDLQGGGNAIQFVAVLDKKACRTIFSQVAQQTRLRSVFIMNNKNSIKKLVPKAVKNTTNSGDYWLQSPKWWGVDANGLSDVSCQDDIDVLTALVKYGYSGFEKFLAEKKQACIQMGRMLPVSLGLTKSSIQPRVNNLTREVGVIEDTSTMIKMVTERQNRNSSVAKSSSSSVNGTVSSAGSIQTGIDAFFSRPQSNPKGNTNVPPPVTILPKQIACSESSKEIIEPQSNPKVDASVPPPVPNVPKCPPVKVTELHTGNVKKSIEKQVCSEISKEIIDPLSNPKDNTSVSLPVPNLVKCSTAKVEELHTGNIEKTNKKIVFDNSKEIIDLASDASDDDISPTLVVIGDSSDSSPEVDPGACTGLLEKPVV